MKHTPSKYNVITAAGVTYGWRCARCNIPSKRFKLEENRDRTLAEHKVAVRQRMVAKKVQTTL